MVERHAEPIPNSNLSISVPKKAQRRERLVVCGGCEFMESLEDRG